MKHSNIAKNDATPLWARTHGGEFRSTSGEQELHKLATALQVLLTLFQTLKDGYGDTEREASPPNTSLPHTPSPGSDQATLGSILL